MKNNIITTYTLCKSVINRKTYISIEDMQIKLDVFLRNSKINDGEYSELVSLLQSQ